MKIIAEIIPLVLSFNKSMCFSVLFTFSHLCLGAQCPWTNMTSDDLFRFDSVIKPLGLNDIQEDLACLKLIMNSHYAPIIIEKNFDFASKVDSIDWSSVQSSKYFAQKLFEIHAENPDLHLSYSLDKEQVFFSFYRHNAKLVSLVPNFLTEKIIEEDQYIYFKPHSFINKTSEQEEFLELIKLRDKNIILDLRSNSGGRDWFAKEMVAAIYQQGIKAPRSEKLQAYSGFFELGMCYALLLNSNDSAMSYCQAVKEKNKDLSFNELIQSQVEVTNEDEKYVGKRKSKFASKIILITDSGCASSCETVVEKLGVLPFVTVVGQNTAGALHYSNAIHVILPNSGVIVQTPTLYHRYENDAPEGVGYKPDIILDSINFKNDILSKIEI